MTHRKHGAILVHMTTKKQLNVRLSGEARRLLALLAARQGLSQTAVLEFAIRLLADIEHVERP